MPNPRLPLCFAYSCLAGCGHCKRLVPEYQKLGEAIASDPKLRGRVLIAKVDADAHRSLGEKFGVRGFPTLKWVSASSVCVKRAGSWCQAVGCAAAAKLRPAPRLRPLPSAPAPRSSRTARLPILSSKALAAPHLHA